MKEVYTKLFKKRMRLLLLLTLFFSARSAAMAQLNPLAGIYFSNEYLGNPAMVGINPGLNLGLGYRKQWSTIPGAPKTQSLTAEYSTEKKVGLGINVFAEEAGLIKRTRAMGTYAYQLPLDNKNRVVRFGISFGFMDERILNETINGDSDDGSIGKFNSTETYLDGDFGLAYTTPKLTIQTAIPNIKAVFQKDDLNEVADRPSFFSAIGYKLYFSEAGNGFGIESKLAYRAVKGFHDIIDLGANFTLAEGKISLMSVYHSSQSVTFGMGASFKNFGSINAHYTTATAALGQYSSGNFQIGLNVRVLRKEKDK